MKLFFRKFGNGQPLVILHGLFGSSDNWVTLGKQFAEYSSEKFPNGFEGYLVDQRNHGLSPHDPNWDYQLMSEDLLELITDHSLVKPIIIGHSMGGKTAMKFAQDYPSDLSKLIVVDIAPKYYTPHHQDVLKALLAVDLQKVASRKEVEDILLVYLKESSTRQFLLKNLYWDDSQEKKLAWRFNLETISQNIDKVGVELPIEEVKDIPTLFIRGEKSKYILDTDMVLIKKIFPKAELQTIANAGHWVHAEQPVAFYQAIIKHLDDN